jgi:hypothetical protein
LCLSAGTPKEIFGGVFSFFEDLLFGICEIDLLDPASVTMDSQGDILQQIFDSLVDNFQSAFCSVFGTFCISHATIDPPPLAVGAGTADASFFGAVPDGAHVLATCGGVCKGSTVATLAHPGTALLPLTGQLAAEEVVVALVWATAGTDLDLRLSFRADGDERCVAAWK